MNLKQSITWICWLVSSEAHIYMHRAVKLENDTACLPLGLLSVPTLHLPAFYKTWEWCLIPLFQGNIWQMMLGTFKNWKKQLPKDICSYLSCCCTYITLEATTPIERLKMTLEQTGISIYFFLPTRPILFFFCSFMGLAIFVAKSIVWSWVV